MHWHEIDESSSTLPSAPTYTLFYRHFHQALCRLGSNLGQNMILGTTGVLTCLRPITRQWLCAGYVARSLANLAVKYSRGFPVLLATVKPYCARKSPNRTPSNHAPEPSLKQPNWDQLFHHTFPKDNIKFCLFCILCITGAILLMTQMYANILKSGLPVRGYVFPACARRARHPNECSGQLFQCFSPKHHSLL